MIDFNTVKNIYLCCGSTDLRIGIDGYAAIIANAFDRSPFDKSLYLFCNKSHNKVKILHYDDTGFWLYYKRFETGTIKWPKNNIELKEINIDQFKWLFSGINIEQKTLRKANPTRA